jgi:hypothetical protein
VCDLETSRIDAPYIYDISSLRVKLGLYVSLLPFPDPKERTKQLDRMQGLCDNQPQKEFRMINERSAVIGGESEAARQDDPKPLNQYHYLEQDVNQSSHRHLWDSKRIETRPFL